MSWFKVDDGFSSHPKVLQIPRTVRAEALGIWVLAGTWSARHKTDGRIPLHIIDELAGTEAGVQALVGVRLWRKVANAYLFVNWAEFQPTRDKREGQTVYERDKKRRQRAEKAGNDWAEPPSVPAGQTTVPAPPSRPLPDPTKSDQSLANLTSEDTGAGRTGDNSEEPVDSELQRIVAKVADLTGETIHPLTAGMIRTHYLDRAKDFPKRPTAFVLTCLTREEPPVLLNFILSGRWSE